jgi:hypothetical protein
MYSFISYYDVVLELPAQHHLHETPIPIVYQLSIINHWYIQNAQVRTFQQHNQSIPLVVW